MKNDKYDLAVLGGPRSFAEPLHVGRPNIGDRARLLERIGGILDRRWLSNQGPVVSEFEERVADYLGVKHCVAMCNATVALEIAIRALELTGEVIVPAFTFIATAHALQWQEITPVFCDIDPATHTLDPGWVERMITPRTTGIIGVHVWGRPCRIDALEAIARDNSLSLLFDAAHAFGASYKGGMLGGFGAAEVFSFHATKFVSMRRRRSRCDQRRPARPQDAADAQFRFRRARSRRVYRHEREDKRAVGCHGAHVAGKRRGLHGCQRSELSRLCQ